MRLTRLVLVCALLTLIAPVSALAADRMWIGFQDDPTFRWREDRANMLDEAVDANAGIVRTTVYWSRIAPRRPSNPANPFDPAYRFDDLDEFVRGAQFRGLETLLTIWGTPNWANGSKGQNFAPTRMSDITAFARALASRYSGRYPGFPYVRFFSVWNEPNLQQFLAPTYNSKGKPVSPFTYAKLYRAAYAASRRGARGPGRCRRDVPAGPRPAVPRPGPGLGSRPRRSRAPLSTSKPRIKFEGYTHHPYSVLGQGPKQKARYPNVHLTQVPQFSRDLHSGSAGPFALDHGVWVRDEAGRATGVTLFQQAAYTRQTFNFLRPIHSVKMLIWFIFRDDPTSTAERALNRNDTRKPAFAAFASTAKPLDARNPVVAARLNRAPVVRISALELAARNGSGAPIGANIRVYGLGSQFYVEHPDAVDDRARRLADFRSRRTVREASTTSSST